MPKSFFLVLIICFGCFFIAVGQENKPFNELKQLQGVWKTEVGGKTVYESWKMISDHEMEGMSYKITNADTIIFEQTRIVEQHHKLDYLARVKNQNQGKEVAFKLVSSANKIFIFENPEHDFPQRVVYQLISNDSLHAWIDGKYQGRATKEDYYYSRQK